MADVSLLPQPTALLADHGGDEEKPCWDTGDTTWVQMSTILVLGMMPALALFEAGLLRSKNTLSIITQVITGLAVLAVLWHFFGFSLVYSNSYYGVMGDLSHAFYRNLMNKCLPHAPSIPGITFALFQLMFAAISPLLMTGTFAERLRYRSFLIVIVLWELLIYYPLAHWIWNEGGWLAKFGVLDFAGGIVIHTSAGTSSLIVAMLLGRRLHFEKYHGEFPPSNIPLATLGAALLWMGWYGFNAGSALTSGVLASYAMTNTTVASTVSTVVWVVLSYVHHGHVSTIAVLNGAISGLAGITPASGYIMPHYAAVVSVFLGLGGFYGIMFCKEILKIDDALDVSSVHGLTGIIGSLSIGIFAEKAVNSDGANGLVADGSFKLLGKQFYGVGVAIAWSLLWTLAIVLVLRRFQFFKLSRKEQEVGLDAIEHGKEAAYHDLLRVVPVVTPHGEGTMVLGVDEEERLPMMFRKAGGLSVNDAGDDDYDEEQALDDDPLSTVHDGFVVVPRSNTLGTSGNFLIMPIEPPRRLTPSTTRRKQVQRRDQQQQLQQQHQTQPQTGESRLGEEESEAEEEGKGKDKEEKRPDKK